MCCFVLFPLCQDQQEGEASPSREMDPRENVDTDMKGSDTNEVEAEVVANDDSEQPEYETGQQQQQQPESLHVEGDGEREGEDEKENDQQNRNDNKENDDDEDDNDDLHFPLDLQFADLLEITRPLSEQEVKNPEFVCERIEKW